ncbi:MAG TPA: PIN domain-containing protein, partial [Ilumatobacteraceae bacterium]|nr:PIN domain-containing protein [Ilumatobacteraceae bacterium]
MLDTCVLYPAHLRDTLLRLAERGMYRVLWSADIVDELHRNLVEDGLTARSVDRLIAEMAVAFPDAEVAGY